MELCFVYPAKQPLSRLLLPLLPPASQAGDYLAAYSIALDPKGQEGANRLYASKERRKTIRRKVTTGESSERQGRSSSLLSILGPGFHSLLQLLRRILPRLEFL